MTWGGNLLFIVFFFSLFLYFIHHYLLCRIRFFYQIGTLSQSATDNCCRFAIPAARYGVQNCLTLIYIITRPFSRQVKFLVTTSASLWFHTQTSLAFNITWTMPALGPIKCFCNSQCAAKPFIISTYKNRHMYCRLRLGMGHSLWEQCLLFNGAKLTFNFLLAPRTRVSQLEDTKQLTAALPAELPPSCWGEPGAGEERHGSPGGCQCVQQAQKQGSAGGWWHVEDWELVGGRPRVQRVGQAVTGTSKWKPGTGFWRGKVRPSTPGLTGVEVIFEGRRERKHSGREVEDREWRLGAGQGICPSKLSQQGRSKPNLRKLGNW